MWLIQRLESILDYLTYVLSPEIVVGIEAIFLAVVVPITIFMIQTEPDKSPRWERVLIIRNVIKAREQFVALLAAAVTAIVLSSGAQFSRIFVIVFLVAVVFQISALVRCYKWLNTFENKVASSYRQKIRSKFLRNLDDTEKLDFWSDVFSAESTKVLIEQRQLLDTFYDSVLNMSSDKRQQSELISEFNCSLNRIQLYDQEIFKDLINFLKKIYVFNDVSIKQDFELAFVTEELLKNLTRLSVLHSYTSYFYFQEIKIWIEYLDVQSKRQVIGIIMPVLLNLFEEGNELYLSRNFPTNWLITSKNLSLEYPQASLIFNEYLKWISLRPMYSIGENIDWDRSAESATAGLFPGSDIYMLTDFLVYEWAPWSTLKGENALRAKIRNFVENKKTFGHLGHVRLSLSVENQLADKSQERNEVAEIIRLETSVFPNLSNLTYLEKVFYEFEENNFNFNDEQTLKFRNFKSNIEFLLNTRKIHLENSEPRT